MFGLGLGIGIGGSGSSLAALKSGLLPLSALWLEGDSGLAPATTGWTDQSSNAFVCPPVPTHKPTTSTTINGMPCLSCNGTALTIPTAAWLGVKTIAVVAKMTALPGAASFGNLLTLLDSGGSFTDFSIFNAVGGYTNITFCEDFASDNGSGYSPTLDTNPHEYIATWNAVGNGPANYAMTLDGASQTVSASSTIARAGNVGSIGARTDGAAVSSPLSVDVAAILVFKSVLSAGNLTKLHSYLFGKYGV